MKKMSKWLLFSGFLFVVFLNTSSIYGLTIAESGKSNYTIVTGNEASPSELHAAKELQTFLQMISNAYLPVVNEREAAGGPMILVGNSNKLQSLNQNISFSELGDDGFIIKTAGDNLILAGGKLRGSMYAVYTFLEDVLGCRWYTSKVSKIPRLSSIRIDALDIKEKPAFGYREPFWKDAQDGDWAARNRCNSSAAALDAARGGKVNYRSVHTTYPLMPPENYFKDHPEWYSEQSNRKRTWEFGQLCTTNPEVRKRMSDKVINWMQRDPEGNIFCVSQNDWYGWCECPRCKAVDDREESHSGTFVYFVNAVAKQTSKLFPQKYVGTLAYTFTEKPPKYARPGENVAIRLCNMNHITGCDAHPLTECSRNAAFRDNLKGWGLIAKKIYIWDYVTNFANFLQPMPLWYANIKDLQFYKECNVNGIFDQGCTSTECAAGAELIAWLEAKLLWNPDRDLTALMNDFFEGYYGVAAEPMKQYHRFLMDKTNSENIHFALYSPVTLSLFSKENMAVMDKYLSEAERLSANDPEIAYRVEAVRLDWQYLHLNQPIEHVIDGDLFKPAPGTPAYETPRALENFMNACRKHSVTELWEFRGNELAYWYMQANTGTHKIITLENSNLTVKVIPGLGGRIYQITDKQTGKNILRSGTMQDRLYPASGGYSNTTISDDPFYGSEATPSTSYGFENFSYILKNEAGGTRIVMTGKTDIWQTPLAMQIIREIFLPADSKELQITNKLEMLKTVRWPQGITTNPEFDLGDFADIKVGLGTGAAKFKFESLPQPDEQGNISKTNLGKAISQGSWCIINAAKNIGIIDTFEPEQVESCIIWANSTAHSVSLRLKGIMKPGKEGMTVTVKHSLKIIDDVSSLTE